MTTATCSWDKHQVHLPPLLGCLWHLTFMYSFQAAPSKELEIKNNNSKKNKTTLFINQILNCKTLKKKSINGALKTNKRIPAIPEKYCSHKNHWNDYAQDPKEKTQLLQILYSIPPLPMASNQVLSNDHWILRFTKGGFLHMHIMDYSLCNKRHLVCEILR